MRPIVTPADTLLRAICAGVFLLAATGVHAQGTGPLPYAQNTADEDWTFLKTAPKTDFWDPVKYVPLGPDDWSLTLSGEIRYRAEGLRVRETEGHPSSSDGYLLQRYLAAADVRFGPRARAFVEVQSGIINGKLRSPRPTDQDAVDVHQGFLELRQKVGDKNLLRLVVGRQEIEIGSSRLISASPGLNVKRSFDGVVLSYSTPAWSVAGVGAEIVNLYSGPFDDRHAHGQRVWGVAAVRRGPALEVSQLGGYYLGFDNRVSYFAQGSGPEVRQTIGGKFKGAGARIDVNYDVLFQWGRFVEAPIRAWAVATETGWRFPSAPWKPRLAVGADVASGDRDAHAPALQSFNPLFPGSAYSGAIGLLGPTNLTDFTPIVAVLPRRDLTVRFEAPSYWRTSTGDGVYATDLRVLLGPDTGTGSYVGTNPGVVMVWQTTRHLQVQGVITRFVSGAFMERTFASHGFGFYSVTARYRF